MDPPVLDRTTFVAFYRDALPQVFRYLNRACAGDRALAEDLTQEAFLVVVREARAGRVDVMTVAWVLTVARNKLIDHVRRREREERKLALVAGTQPSGGDDDEPLSLDALRGLPAAQRLALVLRYVDDLPVAQVAAALDRSVHATESLLARARAALRAARTESDDV